MPNKMLIDASHPEETRVVVVRGSRIEEFDFESQDKKQLKGNIYLARVTRVEPSLQAAFVEYGGNRHGFLAFSEIHPDYYQIPVADRQALLRAEAAEHEDEDDENGEERQDRGRGKRRRRGGRTRDRQDEVSAGAGDDKDGAELSPEHADNADADLTGEGSSDGDDADLAPQPGEIEPFEASDPDSSEASAEPSDTDTPDDTPRSGGSMAAAIEGDVVSEPAIEDSISEDRGMLEEVSSHASDDQEVESVGAEDALEEARDRRRPVRRHYKIQEVIKRRQILLVQVVKEERGNKGAALTTYLSLAGRYSVLMPNTARGGGISRKITNTQDRKRLKEVVADLDVPQGMGVILRTAGESRTKAEIKRDYEYLMRLWETVRSLTLKSIAPALVYEEGSLIKRSVRDLYNKDIDEIQVAGEDGYREAKDFMRMLMPSHAKVVQPYRDNTPIFVRSGIEAQLDRMLQPQVTLKSGGYIIINQTEALVAIDVNSGRSTKEHSIEDTALHTNLEAAEEVARQLRLRDLAGLIVIDFIDMEENRNNRAVEKRLKDHLKNDRARIQVGRISHFGLMEMSRQRIRASVLESTMKPCPHCGGTGHVRSDSSVALMVVRAIEEYLLKDMRCHITVKTPSSTALYVLNHKRAKLAEMEHRFGLSITIEMDESVGSQHYQIIRGAAVERPLGQPEPQVFLAPTVEDENDLDIPVEEDEVEAPAEAAAPAARQPRPEREANGSDEGGRKRRRRRRRRGGRDRDEANAPGDLQAGEADDEGEDDRAEGGESDAPVLIESASELLADGDSAAADAQDDGAAKKRRRGKRGGKRNRDEAGAPGMAADGEEAVSEGTSESEAPVASDLIAGEPAAAEAPAGDAPAEKPKRARRSRAKKVEAEAETVDADFVTAPVQAANTNEPAPAEPPKEAEPPPSASQPAETEAKGKPARRRAFGSDVPGTPAAPSEPDQSDDDKPKKAGWWKRRSFF